MNADPKEFLTIEIELTPGERVLFSTLDGEALEVEEVVTFLRLYAIDASHMEPPVYCYCEENALKLVFRLVK